MLDLSPMTFVAGGFAVARPGRLAGGPFPNPPIYDFDFTGGAVSLATLTAAGFTFARASQAWTRDGTVFASGVPRITSSGILLEAGRTNFCLQSQTFANATWTKSGVTPTDAAAAGPNGATVATSFVESALNEAHNASQSVSFTSGSTYTLSCFAKAASGTRYLRLILASGAFTTAQAVNFDLTTGAATATSGSPTTAAVSFGSGWWRCSITAIANSTASSAVQVGMTTTSNGNSTYAGDGTSGILLYQAQVEIGPFCSAPIPTAGALVARAAESVIAARTAGRLDQGTIVIEATSPPGANLTAQLYRAYNTGDTARTVIFRDTSGNLAGSTTGIGSNVTIRASQPLNTTFKVAMSWTTSRIAASYDGGAVGSHTGTASVSAVNERFGGTDWFSYVRKIRRYQYAALDNELRQWSA